MTHAANQPAPEQGRFRRALTAAGAFIDSLDYSSFDYTLERIAALEGELARLKEELRQSRDSATGPRNGLEH